MQKHCGGVVQWNLDKKPNMHRQMLHQVTRPLQCATAIARDIFLDHSDRLDHGRPRPRTAPTAHTLQEISDGKRRFRDHHLKNRMFESCSSSVARDVEEVSSESSKKMKDMDEITPEASWTAVTKEKEKAVWSLEPEGEAEKPGPLGPGSEVKGISMNPEDKAATGTHERRWQGRKEEIRQNRKRRQIKTHPRKRERRLRVPKGKLFGWNLKRRRIMCEIR